MHIEKDTAAWLDRFEDHVIITDTDAVILHANKAVEKTTGYPREKVIGTKAGSLWGGIMDKSFYTNLWHTIKDEKRPFVGIVRNRRANGEYYFAELRIYPVIDESGDLYNFIGIEPDVTHDVSQRTLQEHFVSLVRHELRNTIATTKLMLGILAQEDLTKEQLELVRSIDEENDRVQNTIDMLALLEKKDMSAAKTRSLSLVGIVERALVRLNEDKKALCTIEVTGDVNVKAPEGVVEHVVENILSNAIKYSPRGGAIRIRLEENERGVAFTCTDAGIGIPEDEQQHLFDAFFRASNTGTESGTGIGLFLTHELLDRIGGRIEMRSIAGEGTEVTVSFPRSADIG
jgi:PAS domain S-box-containing protein